MTHWLPDPTRPVLVRLNQFDSWKILSNSPCIEIHAVLQTWLKKSVRANPGTQGFIQNFISMYLKLFASNLLTPVSIWGVPQIS